MTTVEQRTDYQPVGHRWRWNDGVDHGPWNYAHGPMPGVAEHVEWETLYVKCEVRDEVSSLRE